MSWLTVRVLSYLNTNLLLLLRKGLHDGVLGTKNSISNLMLRNCTWLPLRQCLFAKLIQFNVKFVVTCGPSVVAIVAFFLDSHGS